MFLSFTGLSSGTAYKYIKEKCAVEDASSIETFAFLYLYFYMKK